MEPTFVKMMESHRADRLPLERRRDLKRVIQSIHEAYRITKPPGSIIPCAGDFLAHPSFASLLENTPLETPITVEVFSAVNTVSNLDQVVQDWRTDVEERLLLLSPTSSEFGATPRLDLAIIWFHCSQCESAINYPRVLYHSCMTRGAASSFIGPKKVSKKAERAKSELTKFLDDTGTLTWKQNERFISFHVDASRVARELVCAVGLDPLSATPQDMDAADAVFECSTCTRRENVLMKWERGVGPHTHPHQLLSPLNQVIHLNSRHSLVKVDLSEPAKEALSRWL